MSLQGLSVLATSSVADWTFRLAIIGTAAAVVSAAAVLIGLHQLLLER